MSALHDLQDTATLLSQALAQDTVLSLASAAAWLDPLHFSDADPADELFGNEEDPEVLMRFALSVARDCSRRLYAEMVAGLRQGWTFHAFEEAFCKGLKQDYPFIPLDTLYDMIYGVPLEFCGLEQTDPDFLVRHPDFANVLATYFDVKPVQQTRYYGEQQEAITAEEMEAACRIARPIIDSLIAQDRQPYADLALLLMYLFSMTQNSLLDYTVDEYWDAGWEMLEWNKERLETADEACQQARIVVEAADRAMEIFRTELDIHEALLCNIAAVKAAAERKESHGSLAWPCRGRPCCAAKSYRRAAGSDGSLLLVRLCYAEED